MEKKTLKFSGGREEERLVQDDDEEEDRVLKMAIAMSLEEK